MPTEFVYSNNTFIKAYAQHLENKNYTILLGMDVLKNIVKTIDIEQGRIILKNKTILKIERGQELSCNSLEEGNPDFGSLNREEQSALASLLGEFQDIQYRNEDRLTHTSTIRHKIHLKEDRPIHSKLYRLPKKHEDEVAKQIVEMEQQGIIRKNMSRYASPIVVVAKKPDEDGQLQYRICVDYRALNAITEDDRFLLPNIDNLFDKLGKAIYFSTLDLAKGYHQI